MPLSSPDRPRAGPADHAACRAAIRGGSRSFYAASWLLPRAVRRDAYGLYAFCRLSDDAVDGPRARADAVERLRLRLAAACAGRPFDDPADRALAEVLDRHGIPPALPAALLDGLAWDAAGRRYRDLSDLVAYASRVAGAVGAMMTLVMGERSPEALARACDLGIAMQFTNIARDVGEDARAGRLYLPEAWLREAGLDPDAFLARPAPSPALAAVLTRLLRAADLLYARSEAGIALLPAPCRPAVRAARLIYAEIGRAVERNGHDSVTSRARVAGARKGRLLARAAATPSRRAACGPALPEAAFLVEAVAAHPFAPPPRDPAWWDLGHKAVRLLDLIEVLRERESLGDAAPS
ncbi:Squalene/phytoene synthase [Methylobacterium sp. 4-46]|uniref:phytoene/squalene synthase family protein n=1 Tax=unclassified Methylobacterium TaxID=2615210 RepID=UPI000152C78A|nr:MULTISPECIES: phytoene/squalene synthase family protein [Methylobacterium]ACA18115.1 Squalene/phytoene synthase [Methylobacterium sp. 4-46]WFT77413.1 phytoene/squalene synthase family protein [Methylobacterium nodulans]